MTPTTNGHPIPVGLMADPFAAQLALASQTGTFGMANGGLNPLDLFPGVADQVGVAVVILNSLTRPLMLVEDLVYWNAPQDPQPSAQLGYPAVTGPGITPYRPHTIPPARPYPVAARHPRPQGGPAMIGGVGAYRYGMNYFSNVQRAMSFSAQPDGSGPLVGVAFRTIVDVNGYRGTHSAVTADLANRYGDLRTFYLTMMGDDNGEQAMKAYPSGPVPNPPGNKYDVGGGPGGLTVWAAFNGLDPVNEPSMRTLTVWVRDISSTLGMP